MKLLKNIEDFEYLLKKMFIQLQNIPEPSFQEFKTTRYIYETLKSFGLKDLKTFDTGCFGTINCNRQKTLAIRADIDALPLDKERCIYKHLCGHHFHIAALLGAIGFITKNDIDLKYNLRFIFQPAEEVVSGAEFMIDKGCMENVDEIYALHVEPLIEIGKISISPGVSMAGSRHFEIVMKGHSTHAAYPHLGTDVILAASDLIVKAQGIVSRNIPPEDSAVLTFGKIKAGSAWNIIPEDAEILGTFRFLNNNSNALLEEKLTNLLKSADIFYNTKSVIKIEKGTFPVVNDPDLSKKLEELLANSEIDVSKDNLLSMGGEDFCYYSKHAPSLFIKFGIKTDKIVPLHNKNFSPPFSALKYAVYLWIKLLTEEKES